MGASYAGAWDCGWSRYKSQGVSETSCWVGVSLEPAMALADHLKCFHQALAHAIKVEGNTASSTLLGL